MSGAEPPCRRSGPAADVIDIDKTDEHFRLLYDVKGRFVLHRITKAEAAVRRRPKQWF